MGLPCLSLLLLAAPSLLPQAALAQLADPVLVADFAPGDHPATCVRSSLEPWISDGTLAGSRLLADVAPGFRSSAPSDFALVNGRLFFAAEGDENGRELWALDLELDRRGAGKE